MRSLWTCLFLSSVLLACSGGGGGAQEGELGGDCYGNGTCDMGLSCMADSCVEAIGDEGNPCYGNGTCNGALECVADVCVVDVDAGLPDASPPDAALPDAVQPDADPSCTDALGRSDLEWIQSNVFTPSCAAFSVCHQGNASSAGNLNLEDGQSQVNLINVDSVRFTDWKLVVPGVPDDSYLMVTLGGAAGPLLDGIGTMPFNNPLLCKEKVDAIGRWIESL